MTAIWIAVFFVCVELVYSLDLHVEQFDCAQVLQVQNCSSGASISGNVTVSPERVVLEDDNEVFVMLEDGVYNVSCDGHYQEHVVEEFRNCSECRMETRERVYSEEETPIRVKMEYDGDAPNDVIVGEQTIATSELRYVRGSNFDFDQSDKYDAPISVDASTEYQCARVTRVSDTQAKIVGDIVGAIYKVLPECAHDDYELAVHGVPLMSTNASQMGTQVRKASADAEGRWIRFATDAMEVEVPFTEQWQTLNFSAVSGPISFNVSVSGTECATSTHVVKTLRIVDDVTQPNLTFLGNSFQDGYIEQTTIEVACTSESYPVLWVLEYQDACMRGEDVSLCLQQTPQQTSSVHIDESTSIIAACKSEEYDIISQYIAKKVTVWQRSEPPTPQLSLHRDSKVDKPIKFTIQCPVPDCTCHYAFTSNDVGGDVFLDASGKHKYGTTSVSCSEPQWVVLDRAGDFTFTAIATSFHPLYVGESAQVKGTYERYETVSQPSLSPSPHQESARVYGKAVDVTVKVSNSQFRAVVLPYDSSQTEKDHVDWSKEILYNSTGVNFHVEENSTILVKAAPKNPYIISTGVVHNYHYIFEFSTISYAQSVIWKIFIPCIVFLFTMCFLLLICQAVIGCACSTIRARLLWREYSKFDDYEGDWEPLEMESIDDDDTRISRPSLKRLSQMDSELSSEQSVDDVPSIQL